VRRAWLDLHRYIWRAGQETGAEAISEAVVGTVKSLLAVRPELRHWTLEDDTGAANPETQQWLDGVVLAVAAESCSSHPFAMKLRWMGHGNSSQAEVLRRRDWPEASRMFSYAVAAGPALKHGAVAGDARRFGLDVSRVDEAGSGVAVEYPQAGDAELEGIR